MTKSIKSIFITLPQRNLPSVLPPFGAMAVINSLCKAGYNDIFLYNIDILRPLREDAVDYIVNYNPDIYVYTVLLLLPLMKTVNSFHRS